MENIIIREIKKSDNAAIEHIIKQVLEEMGVPKTGSTYEDESLKLMFETYQDKNATYYVIEKSGRILGGGGFSQLANADPSVCEIQKMYLIKETRGLGLGKKLLAKCIDGARKSGYKTCYLETMPSMKAAQHLYQLNGFNYIDKPKGDTGHTACQVWMVKEF
ncbi:GNAT family N-acetyltransferase [Spongiivirga citrea]|uniref:GNAT family N-acetyltransferase n=1 Tax=Spongiivirga citrea TaxID=1481457 RepID=A0A6M0CE10_9FLAO|nr:GNAT family N-acetyltransferase [Spongiivirga citrea]NER15652.1 GNAT family N-acetyltransferase [Spongiivirga citrea]